MLRPPVKGITSATSMICGICAVTTQNGRSPGRLMTLFVRSLRVGKSDYEARSGSETLATRNGVAHGIHFRGYRTDVAIIFAASDIVVQPRPFDASNCVD